ncbi:endo-1,4-beta-xylanase [Oleiharenicola lentus]|uniref:Beta-xylanase n=1 Tax=Oleiharenicola lentus TaxID=2508720 RepID=A0A4Q1CAJ2_9BACT|nr:endo-1,4-beta-xylanase [Oleiharenicola lentus]RXK55882.1 endo-1,4-beta-xylanase [Oleiharenicola lentus]
MITAARLSALTALACALATPVWSAPPATLKQAFEDDFLVGVALGRMESFDAAERALLVREFNVVTSENQLKPGRVQPQEGVFTFGDGEALVSFAEQHGLPMIGHTLAWHQVTPDWFFLDGDKPASRELALQRLRAHIHAVVGHFKGRIKGWDVVNEGIADERDEREYLRRNKWQQVVGDDYIAKAFEYAHEADPGAELYFNDYGNEYPHKRERTIRLIRDLQARGLRVDGIGMQLHLQLDRIPFDEIDRSLTAFRELGVKVMITELDLDLIERKVWGADTAQREEPTESNLGWAVAPPDLLQRQADQYARLFALLRKHRDIVDRVTFWNLHDGKSWLNNWPVKGRINHPLLFDRALQPKPAFQAVMSLAREPQP